MRIFTIVFFTLFCLSIPADAQITAKWKLTGPIKFPTNSSGQVNGMGRVSQIVFHAKDSNKVYAASASGGLFISTDGCQSWKVTGTDQLPDMSCASVCVDYTNDQIIYLGSGDANYYGNSYGVWKSTNGGQTWTQSNTGIGNRLTVNILMNPSNNKVLIAATNDGIWKSTDAGANWTAKKSGGDFREMVFKPGDPNTMYAVTGTEFYRSQDMGETWTAVALPSANTKGGRIGVTKANPSIVYVTFVGDHSASKSTPVYKSTNSGTSFTTVKPANSFNMNGYTEGEDGQGNYNYSMTVDPLDANNVWVCGHCVFNSKDGGVTWKRLTSWAVQMHTDMHQIVYSPHNAKKLYNANDGGVWKNNDNGAGVKWIPLSDGLACTENYHAGQSPIKKDRISCGTQDNGEIYYDAANWYTNRGGDWTATCTFDYQNANNIYYISEGSRRTGVTGSSATLSFPVANSKTTLLEFTPLKKTTAFLAATDVWRTDNLSANPPTWTKISAFNETVKAITISPADANVVFVVTSAGKVYRSDNALAASPSFSNISATPGSVSSKASIAVVKSTPAVVYLSCNSKVYRSSDNGVTWKDISTGLPATNFIKIHHDSYSPDESMYISNGAAGVYYKNNKLSSWVNYSQGLPTICNITDFMIFNDGNYGNSVLRVSYYGRGVWETPLYNSVTGIEDKENTDAELQLYPNPNNGLFTLIQSDRKAHVEIFDELGKKIYSADPSPGKIQIDLSDQAKGIYILKWTSGEGKVSNKKIIIQ